MQQCYLLWTLDAAYHIFDVTASLVGGLGIRIHRRKQDLKRFGRYKRLPPEALVSRLRAFERAMGLRKLLARAHCAPRRA